MGKLITYLSILIFVDLLFIATGQVCTEGACSLSSILFNAILQIGNITFSEFFTQMIGSVTSLFSSGVGIAALLVTSAVVIGTFVTRDITILFIPITFTLALIAGDFVIFTVYLVSQNPLLGTLIMAPLSILYIFTVLEWLRGKD